MPLLRIRPTQCSSCGVSQKNGKVKGETPILQGRERQRRESAIKLLERGGPSHPASQYIAAPYRDAKRIRILLFPRLISKRCSKFQSCGPNSRPRVSDTPSQNRNRNSPRICNSAPTHEGWTRCPASRCGKALRLWQQGLNCRIRQWPSEVASLRWGNFPTMLPVSQNQYRTP